MAKDSKVFTKHDVVKWSGEGREGNYRIASVNKTKKTANMRGLGSTKAKVPFKAIPWSELTHTDDRPQMSYERYRSMEDGGKMKQGYNDRMDDSLGNRTGKASSKFQDYKDRRDEAKAMNKAEGKRAYQSVGTMDKMADGGAFSLSEKERKEWEKVGAYIKERDKKLDDLDRKIGRLEAEYMDKYDTKEQKESKEAKALNKEIYALHSEYSNLSREADKLSYTEDYHKKRKSGKMAHGGSILEVEGGHIDLSNKEKAKIYNWIDNTPIFKSPMTSNEYADFDLEKELSKKFNKNDEQSESIIKGWEISRGYSKMAHGGGVGKPRLKRGDTIEVDANKWQDSNGNTYHIVQVYVNDHYLGESDLTYGYGSQYEQTANDMLFDHYKPPYGYKTDNPIYRLKEKGIDVRSRGEYVKRKRDLRRFEKGGKTDDWIQGVEAEMKKKGTVGAFTKQAKRAGMTVKEFTKEVLDNPDKYSKRTRERAQFAKNVSKYESGGLFDSEGRKYNKKKGSFLTSEWFTGDLDFLNY